MISDFKNIEDLFRELDAYLQKQVRVYVIGGAALLKRGLKQATKDVDLVGETKQEFLALQKAIIGVGFADQIPGREYKNMNLSQIYLRGEARIDLFEKEVCGKFILSKPMMQRAEKTLECTHITVFLCTNEDILLFKMMTERPGDIDDCANITATATTQPLEWNVVLDELKHQISQSKEDVWITWVGERLDLLEERKVDIPIMKEIDALRLQFFEQQEKRMMKNKKR